MTARAAPPPERERHGAPDAVDPILPRRGDRATPTTDAHLTRTGRRAAVATRLLLGGVLLLAGLGGLVSLGWPLGFDHGLYTWTGDVVARGGMVYRDAWDMHGPLVAYLFAGAQLLFGHHFWGVRLLDLAFLAAGAAGVWQLVAHAGPAPSRTAAWWAAGILALTYLSLGYNETAQPDGWVGLAAAAAFAPVLVRPGRRWPLVLAGLAVALFTLVKPFYLLFGLVPAIALAGHAFDQAATALAASGRRRWSAGSLAGFAALAAAAAVPVVAMTAYFASRGALADLVEVHLRYTTRVYNDLTELAPNSRIQGLITFLWDGKVVPVALAAAVAGGITVWRRGQRAALAALTAWTVLATGFVLLQNKFYYYHWIPVLPPLAVVGAYGLAAAARRPGDARAFALATVGVIAVHAALRPAAYVAERAAVAAGRRSMAAYRGSFSEGNVSRPADRERVARYLRPRVGAGEGVAVWGTDAGILYLVDRPTPFRLAGWYWPMVVGNGSAVQRAYVDEYVRAFRERPPAYLVVNAAAGRVNPRVALARHPDVHAAVERDFVRDTVLGPFELFRRRTPVGGGAATR